MNEPTYEPLQFSDDELRTIYTVTKRYASTPAVNIGWKISQYFFDRRKAEIEEMLESKGLGRKV